MKKVIFFSVVVILSLFPAAEMLFAGNMPDGLTINKSGTSYTISFEIPDYQFNLISAEGNNYLKINLPGYGSTSEVGLPGLPLVSFNFVIPYTEGKPGIELINTSKIEKTLSNKIYPYQAPWPKNQSLSDRPFTINNEYYNSNGNSNPFVKVSDAFVIGGTKGIMVTVYPFSYNPKENLLSVIKRGEFKIIVNNEIEESSYHSIFFNQYLDDIFVNFKRGNETRGANYLIISAPDYISSLTPFIDHKISSGYSVDVFSTSETGTTNSAIKDFIQQRYDNLSTRPEYILLVGDVDKIPAWVGSGEGTPTTDLYYTTLEGGDYFADAFVGRFSVTNTQQLQNAIDKTIYMGNNIATLDKKNVFMASSDNYTISEGTHNFVIHNYFDPSGYTSLKLYSHTYNATTQQLIDALNDNQIFAIYSGHGSETSWADGPPLNQSQVNALTNTVYPFVFSFACVTGSYQINECFGETWLRTTNGGSSFYGSSVNSYWDEDDILERRLIQSWYEDGVTKVSPMFNQGKIYFVDYYGTITPTVLRYLEMYNLMGDPSLETVREIPPDSTAPEPITDLSVANPTSNSLTLNWTAPYDSTFGGIAAYDIRYSIQAINNDDDFNNADQILFGGQSDSAGVAKSYAVNNLDFSTQYYFAIKAMDIWGNKSPMSNVESEVTYSPPSISVNPDSMHCVMTQNTTEVDTVFISNISTDNSTLDYNIELTNNTFPDKVNVKLISVSNQELNNYTYKKGNEPVKHGAGIKGSGGPDNFGYNWIDSDEPNGPDYVWNDISSTGTLVTNWIASGFSDAKDDGYVGPVPIGFDFKFYGNIKTQLYINTNGILTFTPVTDSWFSNAQIPTSDEPNSMIAPLWDDLDGRSQGDVYYQQDGNKFIVQFTNWQKYSGTGSLTFQIVLYSNGRILYYYNNLSADLSSTTVGIENDSGTDGLQVVYNSTYLKNNLAIQLMAEPDWLAPNHFAGTLYNGNSSAVVLTFNTDGLDLGAYSMDMVINSNDPANQQMTVPISMQVTSDVPVELSEFTAAGLMNEVSLKWTTKTETNNKGFKIERRVEKIKTWNMVSFVNGKGTIAEPTSYLYKDKVDKPGKYIYRLTQVDFDGSTSFSSEINVNVTGPENFELSQNYPNPFNPSTKINYALPVKSQVSIKILNILGQEVSSLIDQVQESGYYELNWKPQNISSGIYIYVLDAKSVESNKSTRLLKKMIYMK